MELPTFEFLDTNDFVTTPSDKDGVFLFLTYPNYLVAYEVSSKAFAFTPRTEIG